jgi:nucleoside 2-deoxyribosyltransferase
VLLTEIFANQKLTTEGMQKPAREIWQTDTDWVSEADVLIAGVTTPSLGVGYEIAKAEEWGKPVLALYRPQKDRRLSAMVLGGPGTTVVEYETLGEATQHIEALLR